MIKYLAVPREFEAILLKYTRKDASESILWLMSNTHPRNSDILTEITRELKPHRQKIGADLVVSKIQKASNKQLE